MMQPRPRQPIYDTYWYFAYERQEMFWRRLRGELLLTEDSILRNYKFCNVYRASDRVSQFLIRDVIYGSPHPPLDTLFRIFLFRLLNKVETWQRLEESVGPVALATFDPELYAEALARIKREYGVIYGNAFILCANKAFGFSEKHRNHLALLRRVFVETKHSERLLAARDLQELTACLRELPLIGDFMAYQIAIDFLYSPVFNFDEDDWTIAGPGALRGIAKCFEDMGSLSPREIIMRMVARQDDEFARLGLPFKRLGDRPLHAIDCQGLFCELDKYARVRFPELASNRVRIKASYQPHDAPLAYFYPPKWDIRL